MSLEFDIHEIPFREAGDAVRSIRRTVFVEEQQVPEHEEWDEFDESDETQHLLASDSSGNPAGTLRIVYLAEQRVKITRIAVLKHFRNRGLATQLLCYALKNIISQKYREIFLHAQVDAVGLYQKLGFKEHGEQFLEAGIVHQTMVFESTGKGFEKIYGTEVVRLNYSDQYSQHIALCSSLGHRQILISSNKLRQDIFTSSTVVAALSKFARSDRQATIKILLRDSSSLLGRNSPITQLAQRLPSKIQIQVLHRDVEEFESFVSIDHKHLIFFNDEQNLEGFCCYHAAPECQSLRDAFEHAWTHLSEKDPNLSQLSL